MSAASRPATALETFFKQLRRALNCDDCPAWMRAMLLPDVLRLSQNGVVRLPDVSGDHGDGGIRCDFREATDIDAVLEWAEGAGGDGCDVAAAIGVESHGDLGRRILVGFHPAMQAAMGKRVKSASATIIKGGDCRTLELKFDDGSGLLINAVEPGMSWAFEAGEKNL